MYVSSQEDDSQISIFSTSYKQLNTNKNKTKKTKKQGSNMNSRVGPYAWTRTF